MLVIGFQWPIEHDHATDIIRDGKLIFAAKEERCLQDISAQIEKTSIKLP